MSYFEPDEWWMSHLFWTRKWVSSLVNARINCGVEVLPRVLFANLKRTESWAMSLLSCTHGRYKLCCNYQCVTCRTCRTWRWKCNIQSSRYGVKETLHLLCKEAEYCWHFPFYCQHMRSGTTGGLLKDQKKARKCSRFFRKYRSRTGCSSWPRQGNDESRVSILTVKEVPGTSRKQKETIHAGSKSGWWTRQTVAMLSSTFEYLCNDNFSRRQSYKIVYMFVSFVILQLMHVNHSVHPMCEYIAEVTSYGFCGCYLRHVSVARRREFKEYRIHRVKDSIMKSFVCAAY
jgi:hypothetical protein